MLNIQPAALSKVSKTKKTQRKRPAMGLRGSAQHWFQTWPAIIPHIQHFQKRPYAKQMLFGKKTDVVWQKERFAKRGFLGVASPPPTSKSLQSSGLLSVVSRISMNM